MIPPQVVRVEVSGLQEYTDQHTDILLNQINQHLLGKPLAAMVENRAQLGRRVSSEDEELPKLIFFDTSTEDVDININQKLIEFIGKQSQLLPSSLQLKLYTVQQNSQSKLPKPGAEEIKVIVPFIHSNGDLYVQKEVERNQPLSVSIQ